MDLRRKRMEKSGLVVGCETRNKSLVSIKRGTFLSLLSEY